MSLGEKERLFYMQGPFLILYLIVLFLYVTSVLYKKQMFEN